jgi:hypothetical protein
VVCSDTVPAFVSEEYMASILVTEQVSQATSKEHADLFETSANFYQTTRTATLRKLVLIITDLRILNCELSPSFVLQCTSGHECSAKEEQCHKGDITEAFERKFHKPGHTSGSVCCLRNNKIDWNFTGTLYTYVFIKAFERKENFISHH